MVKEHIELSELSKSSRTKGKVIFAQAVEALRVARG
jgi:hypothetical protein